MSIAISHGPATAVNSAIQLSNLRAHVNSEVIQKHYYTRSLNSHALAVPQFRTLSRQHSFFPSTITLQCGMSYRAMCLRTVLVTVVLIPLTVLNQILSLLCFNGCTFASLVLFCIPVHCKNEHLF